MIVTSNNTFDYTELVIYGDIGDPGQKQGQSVLAEVTYDSGDTELPIKLALLIDDVDAIEQRELRSRWFTLEQATEIAQALQQAVDEATTVATRARKETT